MHKSFLYLITVCITSFVAAQRVVRLEISSLPAKPSTGASYYAAGSFNSWKPNDEQFRFKTDVSGHYYLDLELEPGNYEYKITRGSWDKVECKSNGGMLGNRQLSVPVDTVIAVDIQDWQDQIAPAAKISTASKQVQIITTSFYIPQLKRSRRVWVYLPENYNSSRQRYPVLYMHDGQNMFEDSSSYSGEWGVDEFMDTTKDKKCIVVAIDNGTDKRLNEYCPYDFDLKGIAANYKSNKGEGNAYVDFLVKTLKPFIDKNYRTLKDKPNTYIAGSSMGGLISLYAVLKYPKVFGGAGVFSPAFWVSGNNIYRDIKKKGKEVKAKIYFYCGKQESDSMVPDMLRALEGMSTVSKSTMTSIIRDDGKHNESTWRKEFPLFYQWIMK